MLKQSSNSVILPSQTLHTESDIEADATVEVVASSVGVFGRDILIVYSRNKFKNTNLVVRDLHTILNKFYILLKLTRDYTIIYYLYLYTSNPQSK